MYSCGHWIAIEKSVVKADGVQRFGRQQTWMRYGKCAGHHRGLRAGHVFTGVARELERANCLLVNESGQGCRLADEA